MSLPGESPQRVLSTLLDQSLKKELNLHLFFFKLQLEKKYWSQTCCLYCLTKKWYSRYYTSDSDLKGSVDLISGEWLRAVEENCPKAGKLTIKHLSIVVWNMKDCHRNINMYLNKTIYNQVIWMKLSCLMQSCHNLWKNRCSLLSWFNFQFLFLMYI